jgi:hypothetical protein
LVGFLEQVRPQAVAADPGAGDVLIELALHDALQQLYQWRLGFGKAEAHAVGGEIAQAAAQSTALAGRRL